MPKKVAKAALPAAATAGTRKAPLLPAGADVPRMNSLVKENNAWYAGAEAGERVGAQKTGGFEQRRAHKTPALDRSDNYTRGRNLANDRERYSYVNDCHDAIHKDFSLRFASPPQMAAGREPTYTVLPKLKFQGASGGGGAPAQRAKAAATPVAVVMHARKSRLAGVADPHRFQSSSDSSVGRASAF
jgi:hypothetical protein